MKKTSVKIEICQKNGYGRICGTKKSRAKLGGLE
jgi:hypothetical protein